MDRVWDDARDSGDRTVDTHIKTLRAKLHAVSGDADPIRTHRGLGYSLVGLTMRHRPAIFPWRLPDRRLAAFFVMRVFVDEVKPGVRQAMEDTLVDTATCWRNWRPTTCAPDISHDGAFRPPRGGG